MRKKKKCPQAAAVPSDTLYLPRLSVAMSQNNVMMIASTISRYCVASALPVKTTIL